MNKRIMLFIVFLLAFAILTQPVYAAETSNEPTSVLVPNYSTRLWNPSQKIVKGDAYAYELISNVLSKAQSANSYSAVGDVYLEIYNDLLQYKQVYDYSYLFIEGAFQSPDIYYAYLTKEGYYDDKYELSESLLQDGVFYQRQVDQDNWLVTDYDINPVHQLLSEILSGDFTGSSVFITQETLDYYKEFMFVEDQFEFNDMPYVAVSVLIDGEQLLPIVLDYFENSNNQYPLIDLEAYEDVELRDIITPYMWYYMIFYIQEDTLTLDSVYVDYQMEFFYMPKHLEEDNYLYLEIYLEGIYEYYGFNERVFIPVIDSLN